MLASSRPLLGFNNNLRSLQRKFSATAVNLEAMKMPHAAVQNHTRRPADITHYFAKLSIKKLEENRLVTA